MATVKIVALNAELRPSFGVIQLHCDMTEAQMRAAFGELVAKISDQDLDSWLEEFVPDYEQSK